MQPDIVVGSGCTNQTEPYIVSLALTAEQVWVGPDGESWMGRIKAGEKHIRCRKFKKGPTECMYSTTELEFNLHSEDVGFVGMQHEKVERRNNSRRGVASGAKVYNLDCEEIEILKGRCLHPV